MYKQMFYFLFQNDLGKVEFRIS